jgi:hypothetical protein
VGFGACHAEFVIWDGGARLIEVNDRLIGDRMDLILADLLDLPVFEYVIRLYLGQLLSSFALPDPTNLGRYARVEYVCADQSGTLTAAPGAVDLNVDGVRLGSRPLRAVGVRSDLTVTNRDYLAVLHAIGTTPAAVTAALLDFRATYHWEITA